MSEQSVERPGEVPIFGILLFLSGACALVFQIVWIRELRLVFGATTFSSAAVLAIFMGGLGLGNGLLGRTIDQVKNPIRFYALLELCIAVCAAVSPFLIDAARAVYVQLGGQAVLGLSIATGLRLLVSVLVLAAPTFLMGGTMPAAARAVSSDSDPKRRGVALLYSLNTLGAVAGAGTANFVFLELLGNRSLLWSACLGNGLLAAAALQYSRFLSRTELPQTNRKQVTKALQKAPDSSKQKVKKRGADQRGAETRVAVANAEPDGNETSATQGSPSVVYVASGIVGFAFFLMEIVWYRMLGPLLGGTTFTFGLILCIALLGIGLGGAIYNVFARWIRPSISLLSLTCGLEALLIAVPFWFGDSIAVWALREQMEAVETFREQVWNWFQIGALVILPAACVAGFQFPLLIAIAGAGRADVGKHVGWTFAANTIGAIGGSLAGGFLLLPLLTAPGLWRAVVILLCALGGVTAVFAAHRKVYIALWGVCASVAVAGILGNGPTAAWRHSGIGAGRAQTIAPGKNAEQDFINAKRRQCVWEAEGVETSVGITLTDSIAFIVNGKSDGNAYGDAGTQVGLGLLGPLLHPTPQDGLVIGLGTGESAGWLADCQGLQSVDVIELEPTIVEVAKRCQAMNRNALQNPKITIHYNDAREHLLTNDKDYDLIVSEPSNPYRAGIANLYTQEFYSAASSSLKDDGLFVQWLQGYEVDDRTVMIVLNTVRSVFPRLQVWRTRTRDMLLVCGKSEQAVSYDAAAIKQRFAEATTVREGLRLAWRVDDIAGVLAHYVCGRRTVDDWLTEQELAVNTDDRNLLEYAFAKSLGTSLQFSAEDLHARARRNEDALPVSQTSLQVEQVSVRRLAMDLHLGGVITDIAQLPQRDRPRARAYSRYLARDYSAAMAAYAETEVDATCPVDRLVFAHCLVETGGKVPAEIRQAIGKLSPTEGLALDAIYALRAGDLQRGIDAAVATFASLRNTPWGSAQLLDSLLLLAVDASSKDPVQAALIFASLQEPFAVFRLEEKRILSRYVISQQLGDKEAIEALGKFEPHVPWKAWVLENRVELYSQQEHPLAGRAKSDRQRFKNWSR